MKGIQRMLPVMVALAATGGAPSARAQDAASVNTDIPDMRAVMRSEFHYAPERTPAAAKLEPRRKDIPRIPADVIQMQAVFVSDKKNHDAELTEAFGNQVAAAKQDAMMRKLGVGVLGVTAGKNFGAGVVTVFYVPVFVFAGFSW